MFIIVFACILGFDGKLLLDALSHAVGLTGAPLDHVRVCGERGAVFRDDLEHNLIVHTRSFGIA
jgi:hypothetical protein